MNATFFSLALVLTCAAPPRTSDTATTRLFVRTVPAGARIVVDGQPLGKSDGLFVVPPGVTKITVELDGYHPQVWQGEVRSQWITRVEFILREQPEQENRPPPDEVSHGRETNTSPKTAGVSKKDLDAASKAAIAYLARTDVAESARIAILTVLRQHPDENRWSGRAGPVLFAIAVKSLPVGETRQRATPALLELTHMLATHELLRAKSLLDRYTAAGLTDATTLRQAVVDTAGKIEVTGKVRGLVHQAAVQDGFAVAYVVAEETTLAAHLLQPVELQKVKIAYRNVMHRQARQLMDRSNWTDALLLWQHLHKRGLVSQKLYLDAARCFQRLGQQSDAVRVLTEAIATFRETGTAEFLENAGDIALAIETEPAQALAEEAYALASEQLRETVSQPPTADDNEAQ